MDALTFSSKARTLEQLQSKLSTATVLPQINFCVEDFHQTPFIYLSQIKDKFEGCLVIIRSSAKSEDSSHLSNAGKFLSLAGISSSDTEALKEAIQKVGASYSPSHPEDEIFVQPLLSDVRICGVVMTADIDTLAPYYTVNFDDSGSHDSITGGKEQAGRTYIYSKHSPFPPKEKWMLDLFALCEECEKLFGESFLDIEFAFDDQWNLYLLQVRPIVDKNKENLSEINLRDVLDKVYRKVEKSFQSHPELLGKKGILGIMPDWNPAEIIGLKPRPLALSLYKELVTDNIWAYQRDNYGYRNLRSHPLLLSLIGIPLIDVRASFNSFISKELDEKIAEKLVGIYTDKLTKYPHYHDKIEFEIVHSCYYLNLPEKLSELKQDGLSTDEIQQIESSLLSLTNSIINLKDGLFSNDLKKVELLEKRRQNLHLSDLPLIEKIYWLIENCKRYGTLPFAGVARAAFIGSQFLNSLVDTGLFTQGNYDDFMESLNTVSKQLRIELSELKRNEPESVKRFLKKYGHLRPGTYDILSKRYDENFEEYFSNIPKCSSYPASSSFKLASSQSHKMEKILAKHGIQSTPEDLLQFIKLAIEGREYAKFVFTKTLSEILQFLIVLGERLEITRDDMSFVNIERVLSLYSSLDHFDVSQRLKEDIDRNKEVYTYTKAIKLPSLILDPADIYRFEVFTDEPNFITLKRVKAAVVCEKGFENENLKGKIACIRSADPGYDFLLSKEIAGLITAYGGVNSHMAVRCAELNIPAVIGAGESNFNKWSQCSVLEIDALNSQVHMV